MQQSDPLGPLLFGLTIHPILQSLSSDFIVGYINDIMLGGSVELVTNDVDAIIFLGDVKGLHLTKCKLITKTSPSSMSPLNNFIHVTVSNGV